MLKIEYSDLFSKIDESKQKQIIIEGLSYNDELYKAIRRTIPNFIKIPGFTNISKISYKLHKRLVSPILEDKLFRSNDTAKLLLKGYFDKNNDLVSLVSKELINKGYEPIEPEFIEETAQIRSLQKEDVVQLEDVSYYRPNGKIIDGVDDEDASILAALLGWIVSTEESLKEEFYIEDDEDNLGIDETIDEEIDKDEDIEEHDRDNFEQRIVDLRSEFLLSAEFFLQISEDLKKGIIRENKDAYKEIEDLKNKLDEIITKFNLSADDGINSIEKLKISYANNKAEKNQKLYDKVLIILKRYKTIYQIKGKELPFIKDLDMLAKKYENLIKNNKVKKDEDWFLKLINGNHLFNFLIDAIDLVTKDELDDNKLDEILDKLEIEFEENNFDFFRKLSRQINRGNLIFKEDVLSDPSNTEAKSVLMKNNRVEIKEIESKKIESIKVEDSSPSPLEEEIKQELAKNDDQEAIKDESKENESIHVEEISPAPLEEETKQELAKNDGLEVKKDESKENESIQVEDNQDNEINKKPSKNKLAVKTSIQEDVFSTEDENILDLLKRDEPELAYHLALCYEKNNKNLFLPSFLLQNLFLSINIRSAEAPIGQKIISNLENYDFIIDESIESQFKNRLIFASILRPCLFAYSYGASGILDEVQSGNLDEFSELKRLIKEFMERSGGILNFERLIQLSSEADLIKRRDGFRHKVELWISHAQSLKYNNKPRHKFSIAFNNWFKGEGWINKALNKYCKTEKIKILQDLLDDLEESRWKKSFEKDLKKIVEKNNYKSSTSESDRWFKNQIDDLKELIAEGLSYYSKPDFNGDEYDKSKSSLLNFVDNITDEFKKLITTLEGDKNENILNDISKIFLNKAIENASKVLTDREQVGKPLELYKIENKTLLKLPFYESRFDWYPKKYDDLLVNNILKFINESSQSISVIAKNHLEAGNYESFNRLHSIYDIDELDSNYDESEFSEKIKFEIKKVKTKIEHGSAYGYILDRERLSLISLLEEIIQNYKSDGDGFNYPLIHFQISTILIDIENKKKKVKEDYKKLIPTNISQDNIDRLLNYLEKDNLLVFNESLEGIKDGSLIETEAQNGLLNNFFQFFLNKSNNQNISKIISAIGKRTPYLGMDYSKISVHQSKESINVFKRWKSLKGRGTFRETEDIKNIEALLENIGFTSIVLGSFYSQRKSVFFDFQSDMIRGRSRTPIPQFGSVAQGKYRLICLKDNLNTEDIIEEIQYLDPDSSNRATIVFYFGWLNQQNRIELSKLSKNRKLSFLMLDEAILLYLLGLNQSKFPVFVKLAAPMTFAEPYQTASSNLPEEMFYGRGPQKEKLKNIIGDYSSMIYGGRQLGKTVLQREVQRIFHNPEKNNFAIYVDLRDSGIGLWNPINKIVEVLFEKLKIIPNLLPDKVPPKPTLKFLNKSIEEWLRSNIDSRIILFLDEADRFLEQDAKNDWPHILPLKGLMENTEKRFKVIFSGLHDVRRTIKIPNNPLAHLGNPICVGSMLEKEEAIEAQKLVRLPLEALGYEFESEDLILMILSHCNWYPSLIQIFCSQLLNILNNKKIIRQLPIQIKEKDVTEAHKNSRKQIKEKFHLTLRLDERYDLLANIIAAETIEDQSIQTKGISVRAITEIAIMAWSSGFEDANPKMLINDLLEEMTDLGILRNESQGNFAIRTPNLIGLIGTEKQILENIIDKKRSLPQEFKREVSRINYTKNNRELRSPFPAIYYDKILDPDNKVVLFRGSKMGGMEYIHEFLLSKKREIQVLVPITSSIEKEGIEEFWKSIEHKRFSGKEKVVLFNSDVPYTYDDIIFINEKLKSKKSFSAVFILEPSKIWRLMSDDEKAFTKLANQNIQIINIPQWKIEVAQEWIKGVCPNAKISEVFEKIGNWHFLLERFHSETFDSPELWKEKLDQVSKEELELHNNPNLMNDFGIIDQKMLKILKELVIWNEPLTKEEFIELIDEHSKSITKSENYLEYFVSLSLIDNERKVNSTIKKILQNA